MRWPIFLIAIALHAETGRDAWLRYAPVPVENLPTCIATIDNSPLIQTATGELLRGVRGMTGKTLRLASGPAENTILLATLQEIRTTFPAWNLKADLVADAYWLKSVPSNGVVYTVVTAKNPRGVLYGTFALLRLMAMGQPITNLDEQQAPAASIRWVNQWDRLDG